ncbi:MAG: hypothetical protein US29_C0027G0004 [candidate division WS6 bacterium GW2011_GWF1_36_8]|uniref:DUF3324 domain-containing protein n=1 Tax=candidate division WS6 bacterium GW2011_GWF1_36_8 TaxID=1619098 RepID=A0A0G0FR65_9BACT|nr:MAG: hypothetical protein US29_C0027G0004 [candidate division WS6 bacterium GW2011_GWF1_36_8]
MSLKNCLITILCVLGIAFLMPANVHADTVTPSIYEATITQSKQSTGKVTFKNEGSTPIVISPKTSAYDPKTLQLISDEKKLFLVLDKETYTVQPNDSLILNYEIKPPSNLAPGTYFNLIILQKISSTDATVQKNQLGTVDTLSQLVTIHILEDQTTFPLQIKSDFAQISFEIIEPGVPFLKPMSIKYIYQNNTNYVLQPQGEIQMFDTKSSYSPEYRQINVTGTKLYPGDTIEETVEIKKWHFSDILFGRKVVGRFYNGIDQSTIIKEATQNSYIAYLAVPLAVLILVIAFTRSILADRKKTKD